jgi:hypothetical protein
MLPMWWVTCYIQSVIYLNKSRWQQCRPFQDGRLWNNIEVIKKNPQWPYRRSLIEPTLTGRRLCARYASRIPKESWRVQEHMQPGSTAGLLFTAARQSLHHPTLPETKWPQGF